MALTAKDRARRLAAKRFNEHLKLAAVFLNAVALATLGAGFILPMVTGAPEASSLFWILIAFAVHLTAHGVLRLWRSED